MIQGGKRLHGEVTISGAKNAALPILCASLLAETPLNLSSVAALKDIDTTIKLLDTMGVKITRDADKVSLDASDVASFEATYEMVKTMTSLCYSQTLPIASTPFIAVCTVLDTKLFH